MKAECPWKAVIIPRSCALALAAVVPSAATVVIVVCVSFLVFMIILGVFRIRAAHQRTVRDQESGKENEMDWDDSALTITVNPMEVKAEKARPSAFPLSWLRSGRSRWVLLWNDSRSGWRRGLAVGSNRGLPRNGNLPHRFQTRLSGELFRFVLLCEMATGSSGL